MDPFVRLAEGADVLLHILYEVVNGSLLMVSSMETNRADLTHFGQHQIQCTGVSSVHLYRSFPMGNALPTYVPPANMDSHSYPFFPP